MTQGIADMMHQAARGPHMPPDPGCIVRCVGCKRDMALDSSVPATRSHTAYSRWHCQGCGASVEVAK